MSDGTLRFVGEYDENRIYRLGELVYEDYRLFLRIGNPGESGIYPELCSAEGAWFELPSARVVHQTAMQVMEIHQKGGR